MTITLTNDEKEIYSHDNFCKGFLGINKGTRNITITDKRIVLCNEKNQTSDWQEVLLANIKSVSGQYKDRINILSILGILLSIVVTSFGILSANSPVLFSIGVICGPLLYFFCMKHIERCVFQLELELYPQKNHTKVASQGKNARIDDIFCIGNGFFADDKDANFVLNEISEVLLTVKK